MMLITLFGQCRKYYCTISCQIWYNMYNSLGNLEGENVSVYCMYHMHNYTVNDKSYVGDFITTYM